MQCTDTKYFYKCRLSRFLWDEVSKFYFDPSRVQLETFTFSAKEEFGISGLLSLSAAPASSILLCEDVDKLIELTILNQKLFESPMVMTIQNDENGEKVLKIKYMKLRPGYRNKGIEARMLWTCVKACSKFGIKEIRTKCDFETNQYHNLSSLRLDWETAVTLGFDACLPESYFKSMPATLSGVHTFRTLLSTTAGIDYWKNNQIGLSLFFDLYEGAESIRYLKHHIENERIVIYQ